MDTRIAARSIAGMIMVTVTFFIAERSVVADDRGGYESEQGTRIFGTLDPNLEGVQIPTQLLRDQHLSIKKGRLLKDGTSSPNIEGTTLEGTQPLTKTKVTLVITRVHEHQNIYDGELEPNVMEYDVRIRGKTGLSPLCDYAQNAALAVPGNWDDNSKTLRSENTSFTFSCVPTPDPKAFLAPHATSIDGTSTVISAFPTQAASVSTSDAQAGYLASRGQTAATSMFFVPKIHIPREQRRALELPLNERESLLFGGGAAAKCIDNHYAPWDGGVSALGPMTKTGHKSPVPSEATARLFHNLCTRVMTADYTGDGRSHTIPGTTIRIFNITNLPIEECKVTDSDSVICQRVQAQAQHPTANSVSSPNEGLLPTTNDVVLQDCPSNAPPARNIAARNIAWPHPVASLKPGAPSITYIEWRLQEALVKYKVARIVAHQIGCLQYEGTWVVDRDGTTRALCLAKARWQTIDATDTRLLSTHKFLGGDTWEYCEEGTLAKLDTYSTVLVSFSAINEKGLYRFNLGTNESPHWISTSRVQATENGIEIDKGFKCTAVPCLAERLVADILSPDVSSKVFNGFIRHALYLYKNNHGEYVTDTITEPSVGAVKHVESEYIQMSSPEGYLFANAPTLPDAEPGHTGAQDSNLWLWKHDGKNYCTDMSGFSKEPTKPVALNPGNVALNPGKVTIVPAVPSACGDGYIGIAKLGFGLLPDELQKIRFGLDARFQHPAIGDPREKFINPVINPAPE